MIPSMIFVYTSIFLGFFDDDFLMIESPWHWHARGTASLQSQLLFYWIANY